MVRILHGAAEVLRHCEVDAARVFLAGDHVVGQTMPQPRVHPAHGHLLIRLALGAEPSQKVLRRVPCLATLDTLLEDLRDGRCIVNEAASIHKRAVIAAAAVGNLIQADAPLGAADKEISAQEGRADRRRDGLGRGGDGRHVLREKLEGAVKARIFAGVLVHCFPLVVLRQHPPLCLLPHKPSVPPGHFVLRRVPAPPPDGDPRLAPKHHDPELQGRLETNNGLIFRLRDETWLQGPERCTLVFAGPLLHEEFHVLHHVIDAGSDLAFLWR
mmetsp:Transcript_115450/g.326303  ORF Transcript_115450/g.326303 Transcript_115450/m.326303 type:complete len:271 (+) Transcript_115450:279-1091(+)